MERQQWPRLAHTVPNQHFQICQYSYSSSILTFCTRYFIQNTVVPSVARACSTRKRQIPVSGFTVNRVLNTMSSCIISKKATGAFSKPPFLNLVVRIWRNFLPALRADEALQDAGNGACEAELLFYNVRLRDRCNSFVHVKCVKITLT